MLGTHWKSANVAVESISTIDPFTIARGGGGGGLDSGNGDGTHVGDGEGADGTFPLLLGVVSFNVIVTTAGRPQLGSMLESIAPQLAVTDYLTLISDAAGVWAEHVAGVLAAMPCNCTKVLIMNARQLGWWGHGSRNRWQRQLPGSHHMNADDDDWYAPDAMDIIRRYAVDLTPRLYIFRMIRRWDGVVNLIPPMSVTRPAQIKPGTVSTQCGVYRATPGRMREWAYLYGGDGVFFQQLVDAFGEENTTIVPQLIYHLGQSENLFSQAKGLLEGDNSAAVPDVTAEDDQRLREKLAAPPEREGMPKWMREEKK